MKIPDDSQPMTHADMGHEEHPHMEPGGKINEPVHHTEPAPMNHTHHMMEHQQQGEPSPIMPEAKLSAPSQHAGHMPAGHGAMEHGKKGGHDNHDHHAMMVEDFKRRFFISVLITIPILVLSPMIQMFIGVNLRFNGDTYLLFALSTVLFFYGGWPFITGAKDELEKHNPAMMTLIALAISIAHIYSTLTVFVLQGMDFFWELATLIVIMLLGHWIEMKSVMGASRALEELVKMMPEEAHLIGAGGETADIPVNRWSAINRVDHLLPIFILYNLALTDPSRFCALCRLQKTSLNSNRFCLASIIL